MQRIGAERCAMKKETRIWTGANKFALSLLSSHAALSPPLPVVSLTSRKRRKTRWVGIWLRKMQSQREFVFSHSGLSIFKRFSTTPIFLPIFSRNFRNLKIFEFSAAKILFIVWKETADPVKQFFIQFTSKSRYFSQNNLSIFSPPRWTTMGWSASRCRTRTSRTHSTRSDVVFRLKMKPLMVRWDIL